MKCPVDGAELTMSDRQGIEIDYCPKCRGVWLDRGELDKIIEKSAQESHGDSRNNDSRDRRNNRDNEDDEEGGFLGNLFGGFGGRNND